MLPPIRLQTPIQPQTPIPVSGPRFGHVGFPAEATQQIQLGAPSNGQVLHIQASVVQFGHSIGPAFPSQDVTKSRLDAATTPPVTLQTPVESPDEEPKAAEMPTESTQSSDGQPNVDPVVSKPMNQLQTRIAVEGETPPKASNPLTDDGEERCRLCVQNRSWPESNCRWQATQFKHHRLYFEDNALERSGVKTLLIQPAVSGAKFYADVGLLPYRLLVESPCEQVYALGHYRPGSAAPVYVEGLPSPWPNLP